MMYRFLQLSRLLLHTGGLRQDHVSTGLLAEIPKPSGWVDYAWAGWMEPRQRSAKTAPTIPS